MRSAAGAVAFGPAERPVARGTRRPGGPHDRHRPAIPAVGAGPFGAGPAPRAEHGAVAFTPTWADTPAGLAGHHRSGPAVPAQVRVVAGGEPGDGSEPTAAAAAALWPAIAARTAGLAVPAGHDGERPAVDTRRGATLRTARTACRRARGWDGRIEPAVHAGRVFLDGTGGARRLGPGCPGTDDPSEPAHRTALLGVQVAARTDGDAPDVVLYPGGLLAVSAGSQARRFRLGAAPAAGLAALAMHLQSGEPAAAGTGRQWPPAGEARCADPHVVADGMAQEALSAAVGTTRGDHTALASAGERIDEPGNIGRAPRSTRDQRIAMRVEIGGDGPEPRRHETRQSARGGCHQRVGGDLGRAAR